MNLRAAVVPLLFAGGVLAQGSVPVNLSAADHPPICRGRDGDLAGCITPPHATYSPDPKYPDQARKAHHRGSVVVELVVGADGVARDLKVARGVASELDAAALEAVKHWKFTPASKDGLPIPVQLDVEVSFKLY